MGLYIHIPFCAKKCLYCDFYSAIKSEKVYKDYSDALLREINRWGKRINRPVDTVYIGGGTPSLLG
ncbi:MAG: radical SAM protein, partial [Clostridia bacterium]|nr:radical SAM protein [Clostridia bacterium]